MRSAPDWMIVLQLSGPRALEDCSSFGVVHGACTRRCSSCASPSIGRRSCVSESRSRTVTVPSVTLSWSIVTQKGVPISSWRR